MIVPQTILLLYMRMKQYSGMGFERIQLARDVKFITTPPPTPSRTSDLETYQPPTSDLRPNPLLVTSGGDHWGPVQTCPFGDIHSHPGVTSGGGR